MAFALHSLNQAEKGHSQIEKEGLACIFGVTKFMRIYMGVLSVNHRSRIVHYVVP